MRKGIGIAVGVIILLAIGFLVGRVITNLSNGYRYQLLEEKKYGPVTWRCIHEEVGFAYPYMVKNELEYDGRLIYKADAGVSQNNPSVRGVAVNGGNVSWNDGEYAYELKITPLPQPPVPANKAQGAGQNGNGEEAEAAAQP
ncbi:MAG: hypothetical protein SGJ20_02395 [Planctomycetota bacterium]|nr:hypothetical protein [Planctomycetota bacterium]